MGDVVDPVDIVGLHGGQWFGRAAEAALRQADLLIGHARQLEVLPDGLPGEPVELWGDLDQVLGFAAEQQAGGRRACVLAAGDPGFFGLVRLAAARLGPAAIRVFPAPSSVALACARLGCNWDDAEVVSAHGRPLEHAVVAVQARPKVAVLVSRDQPPQALGAALVDASCAPREVAVCSRLGEADEEVVQTDLAGLASGTYDPLSVVVFRAPGPGTRTAGMVAAGAEADEPVAGPVTAGDAAGSVTRAAAGSGTAGSGTAGTGGPADVGVANVAAPAEFAVDAAFWSEAGSGAAVGNEAGPAVEAGRPGIRWGRSEAEFAYRAGMITKAEVRAVALGKLALAPTGVLWDVGAASGSVAIECALLAPGLRVVAVEQRAEDLARAAENVRTAGVAATVRLVEGTAPAVLAELPDPDRAFVGGGGLEVLDAVVARLRPGGVVVATYATLANAIAAAERLGNLVQIQVSRGVPVGEGTSLRLAAENPVFVCWGPS